MPTKERTNVYLDKELKEKAKILFKKYGLSLSDALNIFLAQVIRENKLPFEDLIPEETLRVIEDARKGRNMKKLSLEDLKKLVDERAGSS